MSNLPTSARPSDDASPDAHSAVALHITSEAITAGTTRHRAQRQPDGCWTVTWLPGRVLDRSQAITAMLLTATVATRQWWHDDPMWARVDTWAAELGLSGPVALVRASYAPERHVPAGGSR